jgi:hypothetical protein
MTHFCGVVFWSVVRLAATCDSKETSLGRF